MPRTLEKASFSMDELSSIIDKNMKAVKDMLQEIRSKDDEISIGAMFEMQMKMNQLSQLSELCTSITAAGHQTIMSMLSKISR